VDWAQPGVAPMMKLSATSNRLSDFWWSGSITLLL
jgi:hypothetical protein